MKLAAQFLNKFSIYELLDIQYFINTSLWLCKGLVAGVGFSNTHVTT
jgi:hypothetical protein